MQSKYKDFLIRDWQPSDRQAAGNVIKTVLQEYGLPWQPELADQDVLKIEEYYLATGGEFWVVEKEGRVVGTAGYYPVERGEKAVEIRKMYLLPQMRGQGLGKYLLAQLERAIAARNFRTIWLETITVLKEAVNLYEKSGYQQTAGVETARCDLMYVKHLGKGNS